MTIAYMMNKMEAGVIGGLRAETLLRSAYSAVPPGAADWRLRRASHSSRPLIALGGHRQCHLRWKRLLLARRLITCQ
jgi:hypothetical protein